MLSCRLLFAYAENTLTDIQPASADNFLLRIASIPHHLDGINAKNSRFLPLFTGIGRRAGNQQKKGHYRGNHQQNGYQQGNQQLKRGYTALFLLFSGMPDGDPMSSRETGFFPSFLSVLRWYDCPFPCTSSCFLYPSEYTVFSNVFL